MAVVDASRNVSWSSFGIVCNAFRLDVILMHSSKHFTLLKRLRVPIVHAKNLIRERLRRGLRMGKREFVKFRFRILPLPKHMSRSFHLSFLPFPRLKLCTGRDEEFLNLGLVHVVCVFKDFHFLFKDYLIFAE